ncbi:hypothetical protein NDU88_008780 [Pleurodeles waltl]|uniref:Uncharacterized protein n=1 Tax=Pleurodeles waltl TaxID=8319 RepID=A0AAV7P1W7_PLEWA|nr:hypothetical protein NDU88_008780 [Pleurodeles waltl]
MEAEENRCAAGGDGGRGEQMCSGGGDGGRGEQMCSREVMEAEENRCAAGVVTEAEENRCAAGVMEAEKNRCAAGVGDGGRGEQLCSMGVMEAEENRCAAGVMEAEENRCAAGGDGGRGEQRLMCYSTGKYAEEVRLEVSHHNVGARVTSWTDPAKRARQEPVHVTLPFCSQSHISQDLFSHVSAVRDCTAASDDGPEHLRRHNKACITELESKVEGLENTAKAVNVRVSGPPAPRKKADLRTTAKSRLRRKGSVELCGSRQRA